jgi:RHH-type proline utilization regulon transcriptional repressor/proline dehydrogenase/delta 1-pyrroline-5-carboxylate dehydrogenase
VRGRAKANAPPRAEALLRDVRERAGALSEGELEAACVSLAEALLASVDATRTAAEAEREQLLARLMHDPVGQVLTTALTDRVYRSRDPGCVVDSARQLLRRLGIPRYLPAAARAQLLLLLRAGPFVPGLAARGVLRRLREETRHVVFSAEEPALSEHLELRRREGARVNLNYLGEAVLGEREAALRCESYVALLSRPDVEAISVKLSSIASRAELLSFDDTLADLKPRLRRIYRAALTHRFRDARGDGAGMPKLVSLDMEAYRDLQLTYELFTQLLDEPEFTELSACLVLQAYLPDSFGYQSALTGWAMQRVARGAAPTRLRIVKGANLAAERVECALRGWQLPIYETKLEVDANYKAMLQYACRPEHARALHIGVASHNLFDVAFALTLRAKHGLTHEISFELLEGMADPLRRALQDLSEDVLVYCPIVESGSMQTAIAYLTRRLDENTAPENFLRNGFGMRVGDAAWERERAAFTAALARRNLLSHAPRRTQDRAQEPARVRVQCATLSLDDFANEPDTDFALPNNRAFIQRLLDEWRTRERFDIAMQIAGERVLRAPLRDGFDPSRPGVCPYRHPLANDADIERALASAASAAPRCARRPVPERAELLLTIARGLRESRGPLIAAMLLDAGKRIEQADAEVSEAIDFAEYYARCYSEHARAPEFALEPKGVVVVTPPWNFPLAIPASGALAALMAGNSVILKPALETVLVAERFANICYTAGVPSDALQLVFCEDQLGSQLIRDARVASVVLTGATLTARKFHELRPGLDLLAETGGKNAVIVTGLADRDLAIKEILASAFGHSGQKCSAASLLICTAEVYDDPAFSEVLRDATSSLPVGSAWDARSVVTPLIQPPAGPLLRAITTLEPGERWLVEPRLAADNPRLLSPGVKFDVAADSFTHQSELFGPVLSVMRATDLDHAIALANGTPYGLTAGLFSLDEREQERWAERIQAGNLYLNRAVTGAIVRRQPFGGWKASSFGPGAKAGGSNYVLQFSRAADRETDTPVEAPLPEVAAFLSVVRPYITARDKERLSQAACRFAQAVRNHFAQTHDPSRVLGESNVFRYRACDSVLIRAAPDAALVDALLACVAAISAGARFSLSVDPACAPDATWLTRLPSCNPSRQGAPQAATRLASGVQRVRLFGSCEPQLMAAAREHAIHVAREPVLMAARIELLHYVREQVLCNAYHRYGSLHGAALLSSPSKQR